MEKVLLVDGHSAIFSSPQLAEIHADDGNRARLELIRILTYFQDVSDFKVVLVFDGKGESQNNNFRQDLDILVMYSRGNQSADSLIERIVAKHSANYDIQVASNDRLVLETISAFGAFPMSIRSMWELVELF